MTRSRSTLDATLLQQISNGTVFMNKNGGLNLDGVDLDLSRQKMINAFSENTRIKWITLNNIRTHKEAERLVEVLPSLIGINYINSLGFDNISAQNAQTLSAIFKKITNLKNPGRLSLINLSNEAFRNLTNDLSNIPFRFFYFRNIPEKLIERFLTSHANFVKANSGTIYQLDLADIYGNDVITRLKKHCENLGISKYFRFIEKLPRRERETEQKISEPTTWNTYNDTSSESNAAHSRKRSRSQSPSPERNNKSARIGRFNDDEDQQSTQTHSLSSSSNPYSEVERTALNNNSYAYPSSSSSSSSNYHSAAQINTLNSSSHTHPSSSSSSSSNPYSGAERTALNNSSYAYPSSSSSSSSNYHSAAQSNTLNNSSHAYPSSSSSSSSIYYSAAQASTLNSSSHAYPSSSSSSSGNRNYNQPPTIPDSPSSSIDSDHEYYSQSLPSAAPMDMSINNPNMYSAMPNNPHYQTAEAYTPNNNAFSAEAKEPSPFITIPGMGSLHPNQALKDYYSKLKVYHIQHCPLSSNDLKERINQLKAILKNQLKMYNALSLQSDEPEFNLQLQFLRKPESLEEKVIRLTIRIREYQDLSNQIEKLTQKINLNNEIINSYLQRTTSNPAQSFDNGYQPNFFTQPAPRSSSQQRALDPRLQSPLYQSSSSSSVR